VFGNLNDKSGTGVLFTRNPDTGENSVTGEFLVNAQGEDVVAGIRTPLPLSDLSMAWEGAGAIHHNLCVAVKKLEAARKDMQDVEFTIQDGELFILQTRNAKRSARAAVVIALAMTDECLINPKELIKRVSLRDLDLAQLAVLDPSFKEKPDYVGLSACSGIVTGIPVFSTEDAINCKEPCILITEETTPDDIAGMDAAVGVLTMNGGATSHAAVVARGMNKPCVVGLGKTKDDFGCFKVSINGATGEVWLKEVPIVSGDSELHDHFYSKVVAHTSMIPMAQRPIKGVSVQGVSLAGGLFDLNSCLDKVQEVYEVVKDYPLALIYVDTNTGDLTPEERSMNSLFSPYKNLAGGEKALVLALENLPLEVRSKLLLVGTVKSKVLASIPRLSGLEDLILTEGDALLSPGNWKGVSLKALSKVLDWKKTDTLGTNLIVHCGADVPQVKNCCLLGSPEAVLLSLH
jgi:phosphohistidine swiveling domain-containing protein